SPLRAALRRRSALVGAPARWGRRPRVAVARSPPGLRVLWRSRWQVGRRRARRTVRRARTTRWLYPRLRRALSKVPSPDAGRERLLVEQGFRLRAQLSAAGAA